MSVDHDHADPFRRLVELIVSGESVIALNHRRNLPGDAPPAGQHESAPESTTPTRSLTTCMRVTPQHCSAAKQSSVVKKLISMGANVSARNRRGAEPLHYAADGGPRVTSVEPSRAVRYRLDDHSRRRRSQCCRHERGRTMHRAVRNRSAAAVAALIAGGAVPILPNAAGSTPRLLAHQNTGKSGWVRRRRRSNVKKSYVCSLSGAP